jgi:hypothetical protein
MCLMNGNAPGHAAFPATNHAGKIPVGRENGVTGPLASYVIQMKLIPLFWLRLPLKGSGAVVCVKSISFAFCVHFYSQQSNL